MFFARFPPFWRKTGALALRQQVFFTNQQVAERGQQVQPVIVLGQAAIADLAITEDLLDVPKGMLHFGTNTGFDFFGFQFVGIQLLPGARSFGDEPGDIPAVLVLIPLLKAKVTGIAEDSLIFTVQQAASGHDVVNVGSGGIDAMNQAQRVVDADVHLHSEVPLITFLGLMHFRITLACLVLGRTRRRNDSGIDNAAFTQHQAVFLQMFVHLFEQNHLAETVTLQEMPEIKNGGLVRQAIQLQTGEVPHGFDLVQSIFHGRIAQVIEQLHAMDSQHGRQRIRRPAVLALRIITGYLLLQLLPRNQLVHPFQKDLAAGLALLVLVLGFGEGHLIHGGNDSYAVDDGRIIADFGDLFRVSLINEL